MAKQYRIEQVTFRGKERFFVQYRDRTFKALFFINMNHFFSWQYVAKLRQSEIQLDKNAPTGYDFTHHIKGHYWAKIDSDYEFSSRNEALKVIKELKLHYGQFEKLHNEKFDSRFETF